MPINIDMPKLSDTMTEGTLIKWHKKVGDTVEIGDVLAEIETDKATMEMEAFDDGTITSIVVQEGQKAPIGGVLAVLNGPAGGGEATPAAPPAAAPAQPAAAPAQPAATPAQPAAAQPAAQPATQPAAAPAQAPAAAGERLKVSPLARKVAEEMGVDLATVTGTGPGGRIVKEDVENAPRDAKPAAAAPASKEAAAASALAAAVKARAAQTPPPLPAASAPAPAAAPAPQAIQPVVGEQDEVIPLTNLRRVIATRLSVSKQTIPHFYLHLEVDAEPVSKLRQLINDQTAHTHNNKYSLNDFILLAVIHAVKAVPAVNASFAGDAIVRFRQIGLAVAIAVEDGLVTPVIKQADSKSLLTISREVKELAGRAKERKLRPAEFDGGTITVSSLGAWGIESFDAIINPPQAAILSVGAAVAKPVVKDGQVVPGLRMDIGLSCDHRVIDGALGARFLAEVKRLIEQPALMLL